MESSALIVVLVPVLLGTVGGLVIGAAVLVAMNAIASLIAHVGRRRRSLDAVHRAASTALQQTRPRAVLSRRARGVHG